MFKIFVNALFNALLVFSRIDFGPRPQFFIQALPSNSSLRRTLENCVQSCERLPELSFWTIGHRGASLYFPEHTHESYMAAVNSGAGIIECDVTFTQDHELVCRHSSCDLHKTTNVLLKSELKAKCTQNFIPAINGKGDASAKCCTTDFTLQEFKTLCARMPNINILATTVEEYLLNPPNPDKPWQNGGTESCPQLMTHQESIHLLHNLGIKFIPELKKPEVKMPHEGFTLDDFRRAIIQPYIDADIDPNNVFLQSFVRQDLEFWIKEFPDFGKRALLLDDRMVPGEDGAENFNPTIEMFQELGKAGITTVAPPIAALLTIDQDTGELSPSTYARNASAAGLDIVTWTLEEPIPVDPPETQQNEFTQMFPILRDASQLYKVLQALDQQVGVIRIFTNWPATVAFYDHCVNRDRKVMTLEQKGQVSKRPTFFVVLLGLCPIAILAGLGVSAVLRYKKRNSKKVSTTSIPSNSPATATWPPSPSIEGILGPRSIKKIFPSSSTVDMGDD